MATPEYVPLPPLVDVRLNDFVGIAPPRRLPHRPVDKLEPPREPGFGAPCPDAGYGYLLGHQLAGRLVVGADEDLEDAHWATATLSVRRAARAGRAPLVADFEVGRALLGYDGTAPESFERWRAAWLRGIVRDTELNQWLADAAEHDIGVEDVPPRDELARWWAMLEGTVPPHAGGTAEEHERAGAT
jgi:hypothetical protein